MRFFLVNIPVIFYCSIFCQTTNFSILFSPLGALGGSRPLPSSCRLFQVNASTPYWCAIPLRQVVLFLLACVFIIISNEVLCTHSEAHLCLCDTTGISSHVTWGGPGEAFGAGGCRVGGKACRSAACPVPPFTLFRVESLTRFSLGSPLFFRL